VTQLTALLHVESLISCHTFLSLFFSFNSRSKPGSSELTLESATFLVDNLYAEAIEAAKSRTALSASIPVLILVWVILIQRQCLELFPVSFSIAFDRLSNSKKFIKQIT
jgi:hypothetical protein